MKDESHKAGRRGPPLLVVIGFLLAFVATVLTVVLTGLFVRGPHERSTAEPTATAPIDPAPSQ
ncbi:MAG TPA: hypothetical protein VF339_09565 [Gammaproteobacteria bacterium]